MSQQRHLQEWADLRTAQETSRTSVSGALGTVSGCTRVGRRVEKELTSKTSTIGVDLFAAGWSTCCCRRSEAAPQARKSKDARGALLERVNAPPPSARSAPGGARARPSSGELGHENRCERFDFGRRHRCATWQGASPPGGSSQRNGRMSSQRECTTTRLFIWCATRTVPHATVQYRNCLTWRGVGQGVWLAPS